MDVNCIFIIGVGRSGTSLLQSMLHTHPAIEFLPETKFLREYIFNKETKEFADENEREQFTATLNNDAKFNRVKISAEAVVKNSQSPLNAYYNLLGSVKAPATSYVGDKDPRFLDFLPNLHIVAPSAKVIHIIRDPREVVLSRTKADWSKHWPFFMHAVMYNAQLERGRILGKKYFGDNYMEIYYEDLLKSPEAKLKEICNFLETPYDKSMLNFGDSAKKLVDEKEMQWKKETLGPLLTENTDKWRSDLSKDQVYLIQVICSDAFVKHPYGKETIHPSATTRIKARAFKILANSFKILYPLRLKLLK